MIKNTVGLQLFLVKGQKMKAIEFTKKNVPDKVLLDCIKEGVIELDSAILNDLSKQ